MDWNDFFKNCDPISSGFMDIPKRSRKMYLIVFMIDTSKHVNQEQINKVNSYFACMITELKRLQKDNFDYKFKVAVMTFSSRANWITFPTPVQEYEPNSFKSNNDSAYLSNALKELSLVFNRENFFNFGGRIANPNVIIISSGIDDNVSDSRKCMEKLEENGFFYCANRCVLLTNREVHENKLVHAPSIYSFIWKHEECIALVEEVENFIHFIERTFYVQVRVERNAIDSFFFKNNPWKEWEEKSESISKKNPLEQFEEDLKKMYGENSLEASEKIFKDFYF